MFSLSYTQINDLKKYDKQFCISKMCFAISYPFEYVKRSQIHHYISWGVDKVGGEIIQKIQRQITTLL